MNDTIIISIIGALGVIFSSLLTHTVTKKEMAIKEQNSKNEQMSEIVEKYKGICEDLEKKVENLERKVEKLDNENTQLRNILLSHGIEVIISSSGG